MNKTQQYVRKQNCGKLNGFKRKACGEDSGVGVCGINRCKLNVLGDQDEEKWSDCTKVFKDGTQPPPGSVERVEQSPVLLTN